MKQCPACKREMREQLLFCPFDGQTLISVGRGDKFIGLILDDKYRIDEKIGEGGMGKVYRATHVLMDHTVAIKILHPHLSSDEVAVERFRREARAAASIRHPNAVAVTDFGVNKESGLSYLVMEFLEGIELREEIKQRRQLGFEEAFIITYQICSALQVAHAKGIIHRDLKPDNIWLLKSEDSFPRIKVLDFGIAKLKAGSVTNLTQQGVIVGTPYYMSPEQCIGDDLDARSDIYSLGIIIYEILAGRVPFRASTPMGVALKHANEPPVPPREFRSDLPYPIENVVLRALRKHREDRPNSAMELAQEFESALYQAGVELKLLGTKTPPDSFTLGGYTDTYRGTAVMQPPDRSISPDKSPSPGNTTPPDRSISPDRSFPPGEPAVGASVVVAQPVEIRQEEAAAGFAVPDLFQQVRKGPLSILNKMWNEARSRKILFAALGAVLIVALVVAAVRLTRSNQPPQDNANRNKTVPPKPPEVPQIPAGMLIVEGGKFTMGNLNGDEYEKPVVEKSISTFYIDQFEVTNKQYYEFAKANKYNWPKGWPASWKQGNFGPTDGDNPVTNVSWNDALTFAKSRQKRLPTEEEWEYAARGRDGRLYPWGNEFNASFANVNNPSAKPVRVMDFPNDISPFNVVGMAGNVSEWTDSEYGRGSRIIRGGSYLNPTTKFRKSPEEYARVTRRLWASPEHVDQYIGFRCAK